MSKPTFLRWAAVIGFTVAPCFSGGARAQQQQPPAPQPPTPPAQPQQPKPPGEPLATAEAIDAAIKRGRQFLLKKQHAEGRWEDVPARTSDEHNAGPMNDDAFGGFTGISTYALLASGSSIQDPPIEKAIAFLKRADIIGAYTIGLRAQVWLYLPDGPERRTLAQRDAQLLMKTLNKTGVPGSIGLWDYEDHSDNGRKIDHSLSQYGVLGLWACAQSHAKIDAEKWKVMEQAWRNNQGSDGSWGYASTKDQAPGTISMTAAGIASLYITQEYVLNDAGVRCQGNFNNHPIDQGIKWLGDKVNFSATDYYSLYGVERIGMAAGLKTIAGKDWYTYGATGILKQQDEDGSFKGGGFPGAQPIISTSYALLFLSRGRTPVAINKLQYGATVNESRVSTWNQRPRDAANLVRWLGRKTERDLRWQAVDLTGPEDDLHDAPILYIAGGASVELSDPEIEKLRRFVEAGGTILANANCKKDQFDKTFREVMKKAFPKYEFRTLPPEHPLFTKQLFPARKWKELPDVQAISNGVRELVLYVSQSDPAKSWQMRNDPFSGAGEEDFQFGANVFSYATDHGVTQARGKSWIVKDAGKTPAKTIRIARLLVGKNPDPEPAGWARLGTILKNDANIGITCELVEPVDAKLAGATIAHLTGTGDFKLTANQRATIRSFVEKGGTLVIDAAGGNTAFAKSAESELHEIFLDAADALKKPLPPDHPVYDMTGAKIQQVSYRQFARESLVGELKTPRLAGMSQQPDGRIGVFFSREDLSAGMVGEPIDGIRGYEPGFATAIMRNIVIYAATAGKGEAGVKPDAKPNDLPF